MALDTRRAYHQKNDHSASMHISGNTLPAMIIIAFGLILLILCIILMAAFGLPTKVSEKPEQISGPLCAGIGIIMCFIGGFYASKLKKDRLRKAKQQRVRPSNQRGYANRAYTGTTNNSGAVYTTQQHQPQYYHQQQQQQQQQQPKKYRHSQHHQHQQQQQQQQQYYQPQYYHPQDQYSHHHDSKDALYGYSSGGHVDGGTPTSIGHK